ncbi:PiggyBac transposable element-derived protein 3 [Collichthys lucidus]|uniref:PiggyBac transposable element-derived protein 3 n=1 Tax=Collichthys lucidus TaxID=240159 RepID=A0A4U5U9L4_COLLU|nr:PiggyBac transposable element-derived protein 3 [Collichthys lucidus]
MLQDSESVADITVVPESEMHAHDTDCDSDQSEDEATGDPNRLPSRLLKGEGFLPNSNMQLPNPPDDDPGCSSSVSQTQTRKKPTMDKVRQPKCIQNYNAHMGGVDLHDQFVSRYRVKICSKKWWWPCLIWAVNSAMVNSWCYYRSWKSGQKDLLSFQRLVAQTLLLRHRTKPSRQDKNLQWRWR